MSETEGGQRICGPTGEVEEPRAPFLVTYFDVTGPYLITPRKYKYLPTFMDHFTKYVEAFPIPDESAEICARVYATQIVTRRGTRFTLITDQGRSFMSSFFKETCRILGIQIVDPSSYHLTSNEMVKLFHRSLHIGLSHNIDSANTVLDTEVPFHIMSYRAIPNTATSFNPYYLLHGREMALPNSDSMKAKHLKENFDQDRRLKKLEVWHTTGLQSSKESEQTVTSEQHTAV